jgi:hypothetical protein
MILLYPLNPLERGMPDELYTAEATTADRLTVPWALIDHDALVQGKIERAVRRVAVQPQLVVGVYRGWMMTADQYEDFYQALAARGIQLVNDPASYRHGHYLPESYPLLESQTPRSVWLPGTGQPDLDRIMDLLRPFGDGPLIVKDYVKSQKHAWDQACFIPSASDRATVERVVRRFLDLQGTDLAGGLVFREFVPFEQIGRHSRSGMPLLLEYRLFFLDGRPLLAAEYWEEGEYGGEGPPVERFKVLAAKVRSRLFTMDVARRKDGDWMVVELGDGQVAGLPERADVEAFYRGLADGLGRER